MHALADPEHFVGFGGLGDGDQAAAVELEGDLAFLLGGTFLHGRAGDAADDGAQDAADDLTFAATHFAAGDCLDLVPSILTSRTDSTMPICTSCTPRVWVRA
jgi:hypothetical protein